jgi:hypothetical protein
MPNYIAFDMAHKPRGKIEENYTGLREFLNSNGFVCTSFIEASITQESLRPYDILVFACPDFAKISEQEILEIENWVNDDGGGLLLLSHAGGDKGRNSNLSDLSELFGITFENDQVLDDKNNLGFENLPTVSEFNPPHPITNKIGSICYRAGCSLTVIGSAMPIVSSNETSDPFSTPLVCVSEPKRGRVVCSGSYEMFRDKIGGGFQYDQHPQFALNLFRWLVSEYRADLRSSEKLPSPELEEKDIEEICEPEESRKLDLPSIQIGEKITNKAEILDLLNGYLDHIEIMRKTIENLITNISEGNNESLEEERNKFLVTAEDFENLKINQDEIFTKSKKKKSEGFQKEKTKKEGKNNQDLIEKEKGQKKAERDEGKKDSKSVEGEEEKNYKARREELEKEVESLESKLKSILNLLDFVENKYQRGDMEEANYKKQTKKLHKDLEKIKGRIKKLSKALQKK